MIKQKFRKKPVIIEAYQTDKELDIETFEGTMHASVGDWIITGLRGEPYPCKPDIFEKTYEPVVEVKDSVITTIEEVPNEDCIDRYSALAELNPLSYEYKAIKGLPSIEPKRGKWIDVSERGSWEIKNACDQCGKIVFQSDFNYCPNCGAKMIKD